MYYEEPAVLCKSTIIFPTFVGQNAVIVAQIFSMVVCRGNVRNDGWINMGLILNLLHAMTCVHKQQQKEDIVSYI